MGVAERLARWSWRTKVVAAACVLAVVGGVAGTAVLINAGEGESVGQEYVAVSLVSQINGRHAQLCLGNFLEGGGPGPTCSSLELRGWSWDGVESEDALYGLVTVDEWVIVGTYAHGYLTMTRPAVLATDDDAPQAEPEPTPDPSRGQNATKEMRAEVWAYARASTQVFSIENDHQRIVLHAYIDDGVLQSYYDERYGAGTVLVSGTIRPIAD